MGFNGLISVGMNYEATNIRIAQPERRFGDIARFVKRAFGEDRFAKEGLVPPERNPESLGHALGRVPSELKLRPSVALQVIVEGRPRELDKPLQIAVFRICREAIVNAYRHSEATEIEIEIRYRRTGLHVAVRDNGCGIDETLLSGKEGGHGLQWMRDQAEEMDARLCVWSGLKVGTEVELCVPGPIAFEKRGRRN